MLTALEIRDFAIVRAAQVTFGPGLCVLSGETGAGKSLVIDAIGALVGGRVGADAVRSGAEVARLRAVFDLGDNAPAQAVLAAQGLEPDADGLCVIAREIRRDGRSRCTLNGSLAGVALLRQLGETLIDLHGQHEHQSLLRVGEHLRLLDSVAGEAVQAPRVAYRALFDRWRELQEQAAALALDEGEQARRVDMLGFQVGEIGEARLQPGEEQELKAEIARLAHAEELLSQATRAHRLLTEAEDGPSALDRLSGAQDALAEMAEFDAELQPLADELAAALATLAEAGRTLGRYADRVEADPLALDRLEQRLELLTRLKRKYGASVEEIIAFGRRAQEELDQLAGADERAAAVQAELAELAADLAAAASALSAARAQAAAALTAGVERHLADLGLAGARFAVRLERRLVAAGLLVDGETCAAGADGIDTAEILFSANPGEPPRGLAKIASGGEISRVMLALKSQLAARDDVPTMLFDEIDVGIGGVTIRAVAAKMAALAAGRQVIVVTHHAPIAALADTHVTIEKAPGEDATQLTVAAVEGEERVHELARMLGRRPPTEATLAMARELLAEVRS